MLFVDPVEPPTDPTDSTVRRSASPKKRPGKWQDWAINLTLAKPDLAVLDYRQELFMTLGEERMKDEGLLFSSASLLPVCLDVFLWEGFDMGHVNGAESGEGQCSYLRSTGGMEGEQLTKGSFSW